LQSLATIKREDLVEFHKTWFKPADAALIVVGDTRMSEMRPLLEEYFGSWPQGSAPDKNIGSQPSQERTVIYVADRPGSQQSVIVAGQVVPPYGHPAKLALGAANDVLGGSFTARLNMNLREDKHWSYGARSIIVDARGPRPFFAYAPVQTDKTAAAIAEMQQEMTALVKAQPPTPAEVQRIQDRSILTLPGRWETSQTVLAGIGEIVRFGLDANYWDTYDERVRALDAASVARAAREYMHPGSLVWVVVGDWARIEKDVRALGLGKVELVTLDGGVTSMDSRVRAGTRNPITD
jgi:zinc protease